MSDLTPAFSNSSSKAMRGADFQYHRPNKLARCTESSGIGFRQKTLICFLSKRKDYVCRFGYGLIEARASVAAFDKKADSAKAMLRRAQTIFCISDLNLNHCAQPNLAPLYAIEIMPECQT
jgi:hypothetical protein